MKLKIFITLSLLIISISAFPFANRGRVDSLKTLVASSLKHQSDPDTLNINRLIKLAENYFESNPDSTLYYGREGISQARKVNYKAGIANGLVQIGHANFFKGRFKEASAEFNEAISIYKSTKDDIGLSNCYIQYSRFYNLLADYKSSLVYLNAALEIDKHLKNERSESDCYKNIGIIYYSKGELSTALDYYYKALFLALKTENKAFMAADYNDIGVVLQGMEVYPKALEYFKKSLKLFQITKNPNGVGTVYENIGEVLIAQQDYDRALIYLTKSIVIAVKQDDKEGMSSVYNDMGVCYAHKGQFNLAISNLATSLEIAKKYKIVYNEAYTLIGFATTYNLQKDFKNAYIYALAGQSLAAKLGNLSVRSNAALQLNKTLAGLGRFDDAYKLLRQYIELKDSLNNNESMQKLTSYNLEFDFANKQHQLTTQQHEKDLLYQQRIKQQRLINAIFLSIILGMIAITFVYYKQKRKQQKINLMLEDKNREVLKQKTDIDDQALKLNDLNNLKGQADISIGTRSSGAAEHFERVIQPFAGFNHIT